jgi:hypothetical protein
MGAMLVSPQRILKVAVAIRPSKKTSMTTITQKLFSRMDSQRNRSTLHRLSRASAMAESHDGPLPPDFGRWSFERYTVGVV